MRTHISNFVALGGILFSCLPAGDVVAANSFPSWWENNIGTEDVLLPGFQPVRVKEHEIALGEGRTYDWGQNLLPAKVTSLGSNFADSFEIIATVDGERTTATAESVTVEDTTVTRASLVAKGSLGRIDVKAVNSVEYDGLLSVVLTLSDPHRTRLVKDAELRFRVTSKFPITVVGFDAKSLRTRDKRLILPLPYRGDFKNAISFSDGDRSLWWFADSGAGFLGAPSHPVSIEKGADGLWVRMPLALDLLAANGPVTIKFNLLTTPVKALTGEWRGNWIARNATAAEAGCSSIQSWWITAFAHEDLPYLDYPPGIAAQLPDADLRAYPGRVRNTSIIKEARKFGIERLPYFSAHSLSPFDPALQEYRKLWEVEPTFIMPPGSDAPFTAKVRKPWLSHNAPGYTNYLLARFDDLIDSLEFAGLYFDQGGVIDSKKMPHGAWKDSEGELQPVLDILATRSFFKRLAILFYKKGRAGHILVHNSGAAILPAYTFVTAMVQGEEFEETLEDLDYIKSTEIEEIRALYSPNQAGVLTVWLDEAWSPRFAKDRPPGHVEQSEWTNSLEYVRAWRKLLAFALLHDVPVWSFVPLKEKHAMCSAFKAYRTSDVRFAGYWSSGEISSCAPACKASYYVNPKLQRTMAIISNFSSKAVIADLPGDFGLSPGDYEGRVIGGASSSRWERLPVSVPIPSSDFRMFEVRLKEK